MRHPIHLIITVLTLFFIGKSSTRNISLMLYQLYNIKLSHATPSGVAVGMNASILDKYGEIYYKEKKKT
jgi:hypothetical protein